MLIVWLKPMTASGYTGLAPSAHLKTMLQYHQVPSIPLNPALELQNHL
jgi:hypothetical protein